MADLRPTAADSIYAAQAPLSYGYPSLGGHIEAEVAIVGGGYAGLATALGLAERGVKGVVLLEAERVGFGASGRNGGFVFGGYSLGGEELVRRLGRERARALYLATQHAVRLIRARIQRYTIACAANDAGVLCANWFRDPEVLRRRQRQLAEDFGIEWEWVEPDALREIVRSDRYHGALYERDALHLDPLAFARGLAQAATAQGVTLREASRVLRLERGGGGFHLHTGGGRVAAPQVVLATGGYLAGLDPQADRAVLPIATYVMATEPLGGRLADCVRSAAAVYDTRFAFDYWRPLADTRLLWGGRISVRDRRPEDVRRLLYHDMLKVFPQLEGSRVEYGWSGLMSYARHQMPQIGGDGRGLWWAQAFGGHGLAPTTLAGELLAAAISRDDDAWRLFEPFGLTSVQRPLGYLAAQARYAWLQHLDARKERRDA
ncbi:MAG: FAD-binding oxidoreductase [Xanthomonadaceae bacterium]|nr:FAD-binding oxidoreductase [Xanthomonadaceae bacterium]